MKIDAEGFGRPRAVHRLAALVVFVALVASACGTTTQSSPSSSAASPAAPGSTAAPAEPVTISFAATTASALEDEMWQKIVEAFSAEYPAIEIKPTLFPDQNYAKLRILVQTDTAADVMQVSDDDAYGLSSAFLSLSDLVGSALDESAVQPIAWNAFAVGDSHNYVSPIFRTTVGFYNKDLFEAAGIEAPTSYADAWDWDTFVKNIRTLTKAGNGNGPPDQYGFGHSNSYAVLWANSNGGDGPYNADQTKCRMDAPDVVEAFQMFADLMHTEKVIFPSVSSGDLFEIFNAGRLAMAYSGGGEAARIADGVNWDVMPLAKAKVSSPTESFGRPFGVWAKTAEPDAAKTFLTFLVSEAAQTIMVDFGYGTPVNLAAGQYFLGLDTAPATKKLYLDALEQDVDLQNVNPLGEEWVERFIRRGEREVAAGQVDAATMLTENCAGMNEFIAETGWQRP